MQKKREKKEKKEKKPNTDLVGVLSSVVVVASVCCSPVSAQFCEYGRWGRKYWSFAGPHAWTVPFHCDQHGWTCAGPCCKRLLRRNSPQWNNSTLRLSQNKNTIVRFALFWVAFMSSVKGFALYIYSYDPSHVTHLDIVYIHKQRWCHLVKSPKSPPDGTQGKVRIKRGHRRRRRRPINYSKQRVFVLYVTEGK